MKFGGNPPGYGNVKGRSEAGMDLWQAWVCLWKTIVKIGPLAGTQEKCKFCIDLHLNVWMGQRTCLLQQVFISVSS